MAKIFPDVWMKSGGIPGLKIDLNETATFINPVTIDTNFRRTDGASPAERNFSIRVRETGMIRFNESLGTNRVVAYEITPGQYSVNQCDDRDNNGAHSTTWTFVLKFKDGFSLNKYIRDGNPKEPGYETHIQNNFAITRHHLRIRACQYLRVTVPNFRKAQQTFSRLFDGQKLLANLHAQHVADATSDPEIYVDILKQAIESESVGGDEAAELLNRPSIHIKFRQHEQLADRTYIVLRSFTPGDTWKVPEQTAIFIQPVAGQYSGIFAHIPSSIPGDRAQAWKAIVYVARNELRAIIQNVSSGIDKDVLNNDIQTNSTAVVKVTLSTEDDPLTMRLNIAAEHLRSVLRAELNGQPAISDPEQPTRYHVPMSPFYLSRMAIPKDQPEMQRITTGNLFTSGNYQLDHPSHQTVIEMVMRNKTGVCAVQGPPATGKTTMVAKIALMTGEHFDTNDGAICIMSHTNEATHVACKRLIAASPKFNVSPLKQVCLVVTDAKNEFYRFSGKQHDPDINPYTIESHLDRLTVEFPGRWSGYEQGRITMTNFGRITIQDERTAFRGDIMDMISVLKGRVKYWCATASTFHHKDRVFGSMNGATGLDCCLMIFDEASQAKDIDVAQAWLVLNPRRIVLAGDEKQLAPHIDTQYAMLINGRSLFEKLKVREGFPSYMLQIQYRTRNNIYAGTNYLYDDRVGSHSSTENRSFYRYLMYVLPNVKFKDAQGRFHVIDSNFKWFDIKNNKCNTVGPTQSSQSPLEADFILKFVVTLGIAGIPLKYIMPLAGYNGMADSLRDGAKSSFHDATGWVPKKIDSSQGDENHLEILSLCRTPSTGIGFMGNYRRQNVGCSRARDAFYVVGSFDVIIDQQDQNPSWMKWYRNAQSFPGQRPIRMSFNGPVEFFYNGVQVKVSDIPKPPPENLLTAPPPQPTSAGRARGDSQGLNPNNGTKLVSSPVDVTIRSRNVSVDLSSRTRSGSITSFGVSQHGSQPGSAAGAASRASNLPFTQSHQRTSTGGSIHGFQSGSQSGSQPGSAAGTPSRAANLPFTPTHQRSATGSSIQVAQPSSVGSSTQIHVLPSSTTPPSATQTEASARSQQGLVQQATELWREWTRLETIAVGALHNKGNEYAVVVRQFNQNFIEALQRQDIERQNTVRRIAGEKGMHTLDIDNWSVRCNARVVWINFLRRNSLPEGTGEQN